MITKFSTYIKESTDNEGSFVVNDINEQHIDPRETTTIDTLEIRKELGETKFPDENTNYENFSFNNKISEKFLKKIREILVGNVISYYGYYYCSADNEKFYECKNLLVYRINLNLNNVLCIKSREWPYGGSEISGGAVDERYPITVKIRPKIYRPEDPYGEENWEID
jgi:hypothetical protein